MCADSLSHSGFRPLSTWWSCSSSPSRCVQSWPRPSSSVTAPPCRVSTGPASASIASDPGRRLRGASRRPGRSDMSRLGTIGHQLYTGQASYEFVGKWRRWVLLSMVVIVVGLVGLGFRGLSLSIDFKGGSQFTFPDKGFSTSQVTDLVTANGATNPVVEKLSDIQGKNPQYQVQTKTLDATASAALVNAISTKFDISKADISIDTIGSSWGSQITHKAVESLIIFLLAIVVYLSLRYEWKMAAGAIVPLIHDL